jgi:dolichol-phosphate mannosyltransferase
LRAQRASAAFGHRRQSGVRINFGTGKLTMTPTAGLAVPRQTEVSSTTRTGQRPVPKVPLSDIHLSIVVTVFSETFSIRETVGILLARDRGYIEEIILLISPRASAESFAIALECIQRDPRVKIQMQTRNPGIGWAYREGMQVASGNFVALMAADLETEPEAVDRMVDKLVATGCDGVIANRWLPGGGFTNYDPIKYVLNWMFQKMFALLFWTDLGDLTFGFKILSKQIAETIDWQGTMHEICIETTVKPIKQGFHLTQVPSVWVGRKEGRSVNTFFKNYRYVVMALKTLVASRGTPRDAQR